jgi:hypothetical protein
LQFICTLSRAIQNTHQVRGRGGRGGRERREEEKKKGGREEELEGY